MVPTFNEVENVGELAQRLGEALAGEAYEVIFVDDHSPDGTADAVRALGQADGRIRCVERVGRRGLSTAVIEGIQATSAEYVIVMDADLQHDEALAAPMLAALRDGADLVVGSRYIAGGGTGDWDASRLKQSRLATRLSRLLRAGDLTDPMSGFFALRAQVLRDRVADLTGTGYKILLDILATGGPKLGVVELPYTFRPRAHGESKLDSRVVLEFLELLIAKTLGRYVPTKFVMFSLVGGLGIVVHMAVLALLFGPLEVGFARAQVLATLVAMTANFFVNNVFTYFDRRLTGWRLLPGWLSFCAASSVGALANVGIAVYLFTSLSTVWYLSAIAGIIVGAAWNYAVTALYTWRA
ncbi:Dolichol-phosphate mannosyltransferase-like protein [Candidatus Rhodobacter oscarellae]|uniref:Dolichol-phosphate mannosyltransferase-like protein n=1 Tax=Candidatus Rhodobacter oscarellae TaxID=1675527 RepID=A0A0J9E8A1_9RHOB|nr:Dolichol-phosphate mannosyltransferase-like protein [Candidatus Rhodobacter lobularis]